MFARHNTEEQQVGVLHQAIFNEWGHYLNVKILIWCHKSMSRVDGSHSVLHKSVLLPTCDSSFGFWDCLSSCVNYVNYSYIAKLFKFDHVALSSKNMCWNQMETQHPYKQLITMINNAKYSHAIL